MILRARTLVPVARPPIDDGVVVVLDGRLQAVGRWADWRAHLGGPATDLGEVAVLPGLVNAHCHLDYTDLAGQIPPPRSFTDWIKSLLALKAGWSYTEYASSWLKGARMLLRHGTTTVGDIEAVPELLPEVWESTPLRVVSFLELTGVRQRRDPERAVEEAEGRIAQLPVRRSRAGLSPHAPYSTTPALLQRSAEVARRHDWPLSIHVAESEEEFAMFASGQGPLFEWLRWNGRDLSDCGRGSPVAHLDRSGCFVPGLVAVHANCLTSADIRHLADRGVHVVHCPRSHDYFQHRRFDFEGLQAAGVNVALGTDSLVTTRCYRGRPVELDLFEEMRLFLDRRPGLRPERVLQLVTCDAARALGLAGQAGELGEQRPADLIAVPFTGPLESVFSAVLEHRGPVHASMIEGAWALPPGQALDQAA